MSENTYKIINLTLSEVVYVTGEKSLEEYLSNHYMHSIQVIIDCLDKK
jgi:hypothetical protein